MRAYEGNRPKRQRKTPVPTYDEVVRRRPRRKRKLVQYVERGKMARGAGGKRIEVGPLTIDTGRWPRGTSGGMRSYKSDDGRERTHQ